jgi:hypothetical protein
MVESTNQVQAFHEPPSLRPHYSSAQQWVTPELGLSSTPRQGILGWAEVTGKTTHSHMKGFSPRNHPHSLPTDPHSPYACSTPGVYTFSVTWTVLRLLTSHCLGLQQQTGLEVSGLCGSYRVPSMSSLLPLCTLSLGENHSKVNKPPTQSSTVWPHNQRKNRHGFFHRLNNGKMAQVHDFGMEISCTGSISGNGCTQILQTQHWIF